jgi:predicted DNA-binding transcriptional regulator YafY
VLQALRIKHKLRISFTGGKGGRMSCVCIPNRLEYSEKDDKFRLITAGATRYATINIARITECILLGPYSEDEVRLAFTEKHKVVMELKDERNALERAMLHFSYLEKETERLDDRHYRITLYYDGDDETEVLIRVLSFGPMLRVISPESFIKQIKERLNRQKNF